MTKRQEKSGNGAPKKQGLPPFVIIPSDVLACDRLCAAEKLLFAHISNLANNEQRYCWASNDHLARLNDAAAKTVSAQVSNLARLGFIVVKIIYKDGPDGQPTKQIDHRRIYPKHYMWNSPKLPGFDDLCSANSASADSIPKKEGGMLKNKYRVSSKPSIPILKNEEGNNKILKEKDNIITGTPSKRACARGGRAECLKVEKGMSIDFSDPAFAEYSHLEPYAPQLCKWLCRTMPGAAWSKEKLALLLVKFKRIQDRTAAWRDSAYDLEPTPEEWHDFYDLLHTARGIKKLSRSELEEQAKLLFGNLKPSEESKCRQ